MSEITLNTGYKLTREGAFQLKGLEKTLQTIAGKDKTITADELASAKFSSDEKTQFFVKMLSQNIGKEGFQITTANVEELEAKMEKAFTNQTKPSETKKVEDKKEAKAEPTKSSNFISKFFSVKEKSKDDIKIEGLKTMLLFGALGILAGPAGVFYGIALGIALTAGKMMAKDIVDPEEKPTITLPPDLYKLGKEYDNSRGNHFNEKLEAKK